MKNLKNRTRITPILGDMLQADISKADVVILTSLCWDNNTRDRVSYKLAAELSPGALVVDYQTDTFERVGLEVRGGSHQGQGRGCGGGGDSSTAPVTATTTAPAGLPVSPSPSPSPSVSALNALDKALQRGTCKSSAMSESHRRCGTHGFKLEGMVSGPVSWGEDQSIALFGAI